MTCPVAVRDMRQCYRHGVPRGRVLLSEGSSLSAREFVTVLGRSGIDIEIASAVAHPLAGFSRWCRAVRRVPAAGVDPAGYLAHRS